MFAEYKPQESEPSLEILITGTGRLETDPDKPGPAIFPRKYDDGISVEGPRGKQGCGKDATGGRIADRRL